MPAFFSASEYDPKYFLAATIKLVLSSLMRAVEFSGILFFLRKRSSSIKL